MKKKVDSSRLKYLQCWTDCVLLFLWGEHGKLSQLKVWELFSSFFLIVRKMFAHHIHSKTKTKKGKSDSYAIIVFLLSLEDIFCWNFSSNIFVPFQDFQGKLWIWKCYSSWKPREIYWCEHVVNNNANQSDDWTTHKSIKLHIELISYFSR